MDRPRLLRHGDVLTVGERTFRWVYPEGSPLELPAAGGEQPPTPSRRRSGAAPPPAARPRPSAAGEKENDPGSGRGDTGRKSTPGSAEGNRLLWLGLGVVTAAAALLAVCAHRPNGLVIRLDRA